MKQSRLASLTESLANVLLGFGLSLALNVALLPVFGVRISLRENVLMTLAFTGVSVVRSYTLRRLFEHIRHMRAHYDAA